MVTQMQPLHRWEEHEWYAEAIKPKPAAAPKKATTAKGKPARKKSKKEKESVDSE